MRFRDLRTGRSLNPRSVCSACGSPLRRARPVHHRIPALHRPRRRRKGIRSPWPAMQVSGQGRTDRAALGILERSRPMILDDQPQAVRRRGARQHGDRLPSRLPAAQQPGRAGGPIRIGVLTDMSGQFSDQSGEGAVAAVRMAAAGFRWQAARPTGRGPRRGPPEPPGRWHRQGARAGRSARTSPDRQPHQLRRRPVGGRRGAGAHRVAIVNGSGSSAPDRRRLHAEQHPLRLRHRGAGARHGQRAAARGAGKLVLPHRRLRLRARAGERHRAGGARGGGRVVGGARYPVESRHLSAFLLRAQGSARRWWRSLGRAPSSSTRRSRCMSPDRPRRAAELVRRPAHLGCRTCTPSAWRWRRAWC